MPNKASILDLLKIVSPILPAPIYWEDVSSVLLGGNEAVFSATGAMLAEAYVGKTLFELYPPEMAAHIKRHNEEVMREGKTLSQEEAIRDIATGELKYFTAIKAPLYDDDGKIIGIVGTSIEITEQKKLLEALKIAKESAESANKAKSEFIANMSHDIRTPLTGILGLTQEMIDVADDTQLSLNQPSIENFSHLLNHMVETVQEDGQFLIGAADELLQLLNEILETMRLESGKVTEDPESFNLYDLIVHNIELMQPVARHKKLSFSYEIDEEIPLYFRGLRNYLDRTLLNLLSNALKFTDAGFVKLIVKLITKNATFKVGEIVELEIVVQDSGSGIPNDKFDTIFEHFSRLTPSYQGLYKGAGLGLFTVKRYIEAMNATIKVESQMGEGTSFIINVPLTISDHSEREKTSFRLPKKDKTKILKSKLSPTPEEITMSQAFVLIVEDNRSAAMAVQACLKHCNCVSDLAETGLMALQMVQNTAYDLILMDIGLPDIEGHEVTKQIRALKTPLALEVPIIALTGHANDPEKREEAIAAGMQDVFSKPLTLSILERLLEQYVFNRKEESGIILQKAYSPEDLNDVIDWDASIKNMNNDKECFLELLAIFSDDLKLSKETIEKAFATNDNDVLRSELHRVRGGVAYLTLPGLDKALAQFHEVAKENPQDQKKMKTSYSQLQDAMNAFWNAWEKNSKN
ncbi:MAG: response regulator [Tatlockia sp.]|nr:response regulator [Tatlockia sp.]